MIKNIAVIVIFSQIILANKSISMDNDFKAKGIRLSYPTDTNDFSYPDERKYLSLQTLSPTEESDWEENNNSDEQGFISDSGSELGFKTEFEVNDEASQKIKMKTFPKIEIFCKEMCLLPFGIAADRENKINGYLKWEDFDIIFPERIYWVNEAFLELLSLTLNMKAKKCNDFDMNRHRELCERLISYLPENLIVVQYAKYLSYENWFIFGGIGQYFSSKPNLGQYKNKKDHYNEKALYIFDTYLYDDNPDRGNFLHDSVSKELKGAMKNFIHMESLLYPIRYKNLTSWSLEESILMLNHDKGLVHQDLIDILEIIVYHSHEDQKFKLLKEKFIGELSRISTAYNLEGVSVEHKKLFLEFYEKKTPKDTYSQFTQNDPDFKDKIQGVKGCFSFGTS